MYNVLWIDDEWQTMMPFKKECEKLHGIKLEGFNICKDGLAELERNLEKWDALLLDAKMLDESDDENTSVKGLRHAIKRRDQLSTKKAIPYFISTGQPDLIDDDLFKDSFGEFYIKGEDDEKLIHDMKEAIEQAPLRQIVQIYHDVFSALDNMHVGKQAEGMLSKILLIMHHPGDYPDFDPVLYYNQLRQIVEYLFRVCNRSGLLPDAFIPDHKVNLSQSLYYLSGGNPNVIGLRYGSGDDRIIPKYIELTIRNILELGNIHSHTVDLDEEDTKVLKDFFASSHSGYIIFGFALQICDFIKWLDRYVASHPNKVENLKLCTPIDSSKLEKSSNDRTANSTQKTINDPVYVGKTFEPEQDKDGVWHCGECMVRLKFWKKGNSLKIQEIMENTDPHTKSKYRYFGSFRIINQ